MTTHIRGPVRRASRLTLALAVVAATFTALVIARPALGQEDPGSGDGILPPGDWTDQQVADARDLVDRTEAALPQYADSSQLEALGFYNFGIAAPGGYDHWINPGWIDDGHLLDPDFPESLVYRYLPNGGYELQAAMFYLPTGTTMDTIAEDLRWLPGWHMHDELCVDETGRFTGLVHADGSCSVGQPADMPPMTHVWIVDNDCGHRFASIGVGGIECDVTHPHGPEDPEHPMDPDDPAPHDPEHPQNPEHPGPAGPDDHGPDHQGPDDQGPDHHDHMAPEAPPADPVHDHPTYTG